MSSSPYDERPWLALYPEGLPSNLPQPDGTALDMFDAAVRARPSGAAIHFLDATLTFTDIDAASDSLGAALQSRGVVEGDRVALFLQNTPSLVIALVAAWKVGAIGVTLNPMLKQRELLHHLADSGATVLIVLDQLHEDVARHIADEAGICVTIVAQSRSGLPSVPRPVPSAAVDGFDALLEEFRGIQPARPSVEASAPAYLVYTSGTTGPPKGAMVTHAGVVFNSNTFMILMGLTGDDVILGGAPLFHITGLVAGIGASHAAACPLVLFDRFDAGVCLRMISQWRATFSVMAITAYLALLDHADREHSDLSSMTKLYSGGAPVSSAVASRWERAVGCPLHNIYGLTETTSPSHWTPLGHAGPVDRESGALAVGIPVPSARVKIVDPDTHAAVRAGEVGEILIAGPMVVPGYWRREAETEAAFDGEYLKTGDIGKMDQDGWFFVVDRSKDLINAAGYKIWPREVEDVLYEHEAVREAAVVGVPDPYRGETVKAYVSLNRGADVDAPTLIAFCRERLAAYKYPRLIEFLDELPKTTSGKILRRELRSHSEETAS